MICGIDPGVTGGVFAIDDNGEERFRSVMPANSGMIDIPALANFFRNDIPNCHVFLEQAQSFPKQGVASSFNYGRGFGSIEGVLGTLGIPYTLVRPNIWTRELHQGLAKEITAKDKSFLIVKRLFPKLDLRASQKCRKFHEGLIDALLIAEYGRRVLNQGIKVVSEKKFPGPDSSLS